MKPPFFCFNPASTAVLTFILATTTPGTALAGASPNQPAYVRPDLEGVSLEIQSPTNAIRVGDEIPIAFIITSHRTNNFIYFDRPEADGRSDQYKLVATNSSGQKVPDLRCGATNSEESVRRSGAQGLLRPGESVTNVIALNRWALLTQPGLYQVTGICGSFISPSINATSAPISLTLLPRSDAEMADYIGSLTNEIARRLAPEAGQTARHYDGELHELVMKLMYTGKPEMVPTLFRVLEESSHEGRWFREALEFYLPHSEQIKQALKTESEKEIPDVNTKNWLQFTLRRYAVSNEVPATAADSAGDGICLEIRCTNTVLKQGDEIPIEFIVSDLGRADYKFEDRTYDRSGRMDEYQVYAKKITGQWLPDPRQNFRGGFGGGLFQYSVLHSGESFTKVVPLQRWALLTEPGEYEVTGAYLGRSRGSDAAGQIKAQPLRITVLPRTPEEMIHYISDLTNQVMKLLAVEPPKVGPPSPDLSDLVMKLMYTGRAEIVPALLRVLSERGPKMAKEGGTLNFGNEGFYVNEALDYYVPRTPGVADAIIAAATKQGYIGNLNNLLEKYEFTLPQFKPLIERALAATNDDLGEWRNGASLADMSYYEDSFAPRLIFIATNTDAPASTRGEAFYTLANHRSDSGVKTLKSLLSTDDQKLWTPLALALLNSLNPQVQRPPGIRVQPLDFDNRDVLPLLQHMLVSTDLTDRIFGTSLAEQFDDDALTPQLIALALDSNRATRDSAIYALALNRTDAGLKTLKALLKDADPQVVTTTEAAIRNAYSSHDLSRGKPLLPGDFDPKYGAPEGKPAPPELR